ncbi:helix-turn-helix domain-containing protein [Kineococcus sp. R86509]|uniref:helix-turn-helix domain-containing protein n=1 Tax=Kineococcus sp. R86509 TaxID=3093851 RepID=UPI0036D2EBE5
MNGDRDDALQALTEHVTRLAEQVAARADQSRHPSALLTYADVAAQLKVTENWVRDAARTGSIPRRQIGRTFRFAQEDVDEFVASTYRAGRDPYARTARQFAAMNRGKRKAS